jgi:CheY-like chemotaxis protein
MTAQSMSGATAAELDAARLLLARMGITPTTTRCFSAACAPCSIPPLEVVAETATSDEAVAAATERQPDVVVMDIQMPGLNGIDATREIVTRSPHVGVLILTMFEDDDSVFAAMRAGARGYLLKGSAPPDIVRAIETVGRGEAVFGPAIARRLIDFFATTPAYPFPELTQREREVLDLVGLWRRGRGAGTLYFGIAATLFLLIHLPFTWASVTGADTNPANHTQPSHPSSG